MVDFFIRLENEESFLDLGSHVILDILRVNLERSYLIMLNLVHLIDTDFVLVAWMWLDLHDLSLDAFPLHKVKPVIEASHDLSLLHLAWFTEYLRWMVGRRHTKVYYSITEL